MQDISKKQWLIGTLLALIFLAFFFAWLFTDQIIVLSENSDWVRPAIWFSLGISLLSLTAFVSKQKGVMNIASVVAFIPILLFVQESLLVFFICIGIFLSGWGLMSMRRDVESHRHIRVRRSVQHGIGRLVFAFALVISTLYYTNIRDVNGEELLQKLSIDQTSNVLLKQALGMMNPEFKKIHKENVTVDEFLLTVPKSDTTNDQIVSNPSDAELLQMAGVMPTDPRANQVLAQMRDGLKKNTASLNTQKLMLEQGKKQLSGIVGKPLSGQESIADVLSQIIDQHIRTYFKPDMTNDSSLLLSFILSLILFITLWSLGSILSFIWRILTAVLFALLRRFGVIEVNKVMVEQEVIN
jgi:hypothetical protein